MIYKKNKELQNLHIGDNEIQKVLLGEHLIWENNKVVYLGEGKTFNIKALYPNLYSQLTADNFLMLSGSSVNQWDRITVQQGSYEYLEIYDGIIKSYNSSTGILSFYTWIRTGSEDTSTGNAKVVMVTKLEKLDYIGYGTSFNIKNIYPNDYQNMTVDNFAFTTMKHWNGSGTTGRSCNAGRAGYGTYTVSGNFGIVKSYNASTGMLSFYGRSWGTDTPDGSWDRGSSLYVYGSKRAMVRSV